MFNKIFNYLKNKIKYESYGCKDYTRTTFEIFKSNYVITRKSLKLKSYLHELFNVIDNEDLERAENLYKNADEYWIYYDPDFTKVEMQIKHLKRRLFEKKIND